MTHVLDEYVEFTIKKIKKFNKQIICITYLKESLILEDKLLELFCSKYESIVNQNKDSFMIIDARNIKSVDFEKALTKISIFKKLDKIVENNIFCISYLINNIIFKNMINTIVELYPPAVPIKVCNENKEVLKFLENIYTKNN
tara:strand:- start:63 stop:491 length:429 start_codon:yes stop_codon:yes gene_type:complete